MKSKTSSPTSEPRLRVGLKDATREEFAAAVQEHLGKQRITIMLDASIIAYFKAKAGDLSYQTLINQTLHEVMRDDRRNEQMEETLRRVIREEIRQPSPG